MDYSEIRVLLIDDVMTTRHLVRKQLKNFGFTKIIEAGDGDEAFEALRQSEQANAPIQLIVSDWNMPKMSGLDLLKRCRASSEWKNLPIILLTSQSDMEQVTEAVMAGVSQYVVKPLVPSVFEEKLKLAWAKHHKL